MDGNTVDAGMFSFNFRVVSLSKHIAIEMVSDWDVTQTNKLVDVCSDCFDLNVSFNVCN